MTIPKPHVSVIDYDSRNYSPSVIVEGDILLFGSTRRRYCVISIRRSFDGIFHFEVIDMMTLVKNRLNFPMNFPVTVSMKIDERI